MTLISTINQKLQAAFTAAGLATDHAYARSADRPDLADFQCNGALALAKAEKANPRALAEKIVSHLDDPMFADISIAGPGFINLKLTDTALAEFANQLGEDERHGVERPLAGEKIMIDYGGINVAKEMHVGHLRTAIIGQSLKLLTRWLGAEVIGDIHLGDWGKQYGMLINEFEWTYPDSPYFSKDSNDWPPEPTFDLSELGKLYKQASARCKEDPIADEAARQTTRKLQDGNPNYRHLWQHFVALTVGDAKEIYAWLNVDFELWNGESNAHESQVALITELTERKIIEESDGALIIRVGQDPHGNDMPPLIYRTKNGGYTYGSSDLATIHDRMRDRQPTRIYYVVDERQRLHFMQLFDACQRVIGWDISLDYFGFGTINGKDGKPYKTRSGEAFRMRDLIEDAEGLAKENLPEITAENATEIKQLARDIAVAAIKFQDLRNSRNSDYVFDADEFMRFEGKTGPYLQYANARTNAVMARAQAAAIAPGEISITEAEERELILKLAQFPVVVQRALDKMDTSFLATHGFELAQLFSRFYQACPILAAPERATQQSRLALTLLVQQQLQLVLQLLAIPAPQQMLRRETEAGEQ